MSRVMFTLSPTGQVISKKPVTLNEMQQLIRESIAIIGERSLELFDNPNTFAFKHNGEWVVIDHKACEFALSRGYQGSIYLNN